MKEITLDTHQEDALSKILSWYKQVKALPPAARLREEQQIFYLTGYAGTGKTTVIGEFKRALTDVHKSERKPNPRVLHAAFTGKAAHQMTRHGVPAQTIHSLIYKLEDDTGKELKWTLNDTSPLLTADLLVLDECSMVNDDMGRDLLSFNKPILVVGDPGQLPPVKGTGFFTNRPPNSRLTTVHRQALGNPIIELATRIRNGSPIGKQDLPQLKVYPRWSEHSMSLKDFDQIIVGKNATRTYMNRVMRKAYGYDEHSPDLPVEGDKVICTRNNKKEGLLNGMMGTVCCDPEIDGDRIIFDFIDDTDKLHKDVEIHTICFTDPDAMKNLTGYERMEFNEFDFGYAITCHKAQGSQWDNVLVLDDGMLLWDRPNRVKWLYTAVTRAAESLVLSKWRKPKNG